jgi:tetratricopeptide (TPR) repeat protein
LERDWAQFQTKSGQLEWALVNYNFALKLFRDLAATDRDRYAEDVALCLNNLGSYHFGRADFSASEACFMEALGIRRALPPDQKGYLRNLHISLMNLGILRVEMGDYDSARSLYSESLDLCHQRLDSEHGAIVDLARQQALMSLCLARIPAAKSDGAEYARRAVSSLSLVSQSNPEDAAALRPLIEEAIRVSNINL